MLIISVFLIGGFKAGTTEEIFYGSRLGNLKSKVYKKDVYKRQQSTVRRPLHKGSSTPGDQTSQPSTVHKCPCSQMSKDARSAAHGSGRCV